MKTSIPYLQKYAKGLITKHHIKKGYYQMPCPEISIDKKLPPHFGGRAIGWYSIIIAPWMMGDKEATKGTVRHELAHCIVSWLNLPCKISHGKEFHDILKKIAPKTWKGDLHWEYTPAITAERERFIKPRKQYVLKEHVYKCPNPDCSVKPVWRWKRVPSYVKRGLTYCPYCKAEGFLMEIKE